MSPPQFSQHAMLHLQECDALPFILPLWRWDVFTAAVSAVFRSFLLQRNGRLNEGLHLLGINLFLEILPQWCWCSDLQINHLNTTIIVVSARDERFPERSGSPQRIQQLKLQHFTNSLVCRIKKLLKMFSAGLWRKRINQRKKQICESRLLSCSFSLFQTGFFSSLRRFPINGWRIKCKNRRSFTPENSHFGWNWYFYQRVMKMMPYFCYGWLQAVTESGHWFSVWNPTVRYMNELNGGTFLFHPDCTPWGLKCQTRTVITSHQG